LNILPEDLHVFHQILISLGLGLLVGLQREWSESPIAGIRSFSLITIFGTVTAILSESYGHWIIGIGLGATTLMMLINHFTNPNLENSKDHRELVTETGILLMFCCGIIVRTGPVLLAASIAGIIAVLLHLKTELHSLALKFSRDEIRSILQFVLLTLVILPVIPNKSYGPYDFFNPYNVWLMVVLIVGISLTGYIFYKFLGKRAGVFLTGFFGGVLSSTATTFSYSKASKNSNDSIVYAGLIILIAWATLYGRVLLELAVTSPQFSSIRIPLLIMTIFAVLPLLWIWRRSKGVVSQEHLPGNPSELRTAFIFALLYSAVLLASSFFKDRFGGSGLSVLAVIFGITDVDAITLSTGRLVNTGQILEDEGHSIILIAIVSNIFFKGLVVWVLGDKRLTKIVAVPWLISLAAGAALILYKYSV
jgi:uncharacterized membrane protein (DUF4010 family)